MTETSESSLFGQLFKACLLAGSLPLALQILLWSRRESGTGFSSFLGLAGTESATPTIFVAGIAALALVLTSWALAGRIANAVNPIVRVFSGALARVTAHDYGARVEISGLGPDWTLLGEEFNALLEWQQREILNLQLEVHQAAALRESSRQLIEECIYAREPLAKQHPDLAAAYASAAIRHAGEAQDNENETVEGLVVGVDKAGHCRGKRENRGNLRWIPEEVRLEAPVPSKLINMSVSGMAVEANRGLPVGGSWVFRICTDALSYDIPGRVCWCRLNRTKKVDGEVHPVYRTGIAFDRELSGKAFEFFGPASLGAAGTVMATS